MRLFLALSLLCLQVSTATAETRGSGDYRSNQGSRRLRSKQAPKKRYHHNPDLNDNNNDIEARDVEGGSDTGSYAADDEASRGSLAYSQTHVFLGPSILRGNWAASPRQTTMVSLGLGQFIHTRPFYLDINASLLVSPSTPRNFMLSGNMGAGLIASSQHVMPFVGFQAGAARMVVSGKGNAFGFRLAPEVGLFPVRIKSHPLYLKAQYNWMTSRVADKVPSWFSLLIGITF